MPTTLTLFCFARPHRDTLNFLPPETRDVAARDSGDKCIQRTDLDTVYGLLGNLSAFSL